MLEPIKRPRTVDQAKALLEQFASLDGQIAAIETNRTECIADVNQRCDTASADLVARRDDIRAKLAPWWAKAGEKLTEGKRKSIELGGCMVGSRAGRASLAIAGEEKDVVALLKSLRWAKPFLRIKTSLDRAALLKATNGPRKVALAELGIEREDGAEQFYIERVAQGGTLGGGA